VETLRISTSRTSCSVKANKKASHANHLVDSVGQAGSPKLVQQYHPPLGDFSDGGQQELDARVLCPGLAESGATGRTKQSGAHRGKGGLSDFERGFHVFITGTPLTR
jgi:hypothetical protein